MIERGRAQKCSNTERVLLIQAESESDSTVAAFVQCDWSTFLISNGLSDLPFLYSLMLRFAENGPTHNFEVVGKQIGHLKSAIGCLLEVRTKTFC